MRSSTENHCGRGKSSDRPGRSGPGKTRRRRGGDESSPIPSGAGSLSPPRGTGSRSFSTGPECGSSLSIMLETPSTPRGLPRAPLFPHSSAPREPWFSRPLHPVPTDTGNEPSSLVAEHRSREGSREDHDGGLRGHRSFRYDRVHRDVQGSAGIRRQGSRHQHGHQHLLRATQDRKGRLRGQSSGRRL